MDQEGRTGRALLRSRDLFILEPAAVTSFTLIPPVDRSSLRLRLLLFFRVFTRKKISAVFKKKKIGVICSNNMILRYMRVRFDVFALMRF